MDAVAFPPPPPPFLDDGFDFGDFAFDPAPPGHPPPAPQPAAFDDDWGDFVESSLGPDPRGTAPATPSSDKSSAGAWEKPRGPLPLSLFGSDDKEEEEGAARPPPATATATEHQRAPSFASRGERPADLKDLIVGLYGSQCPCTNDDVPGPEAEEDDDGFGDDGWEFKAAPSSAAGCDGIEAQEDVSLPVEMYKYSESILHTFKLAFREEHSGYVGAWYRMLLSCAQELQHGAVLWQESCHANICDQVISKGIHYFIALGEVYRVAQILHLSLRCFKPLVLADPGMLSKMLACWDSCTNAWTNCLEMAFGLAIDSNQSDTSVAKSLLESIVYINKLEVTNLQNVLSGNEMTCRLTLLPTSFIPGMRTMVWNCDHYFVKVANLWTNRISSDLGRFSPSSTNNTT